MKLHSPFGFKIMRRNLFSCVCAILLVGCGASKHEHEELAVVNRSKSYLDRIVVFDDQAKEGRRILNTPIKGLRTFYPLGLSLRGTLTVTVLKEGTQWAESHFSLGKYRAASENADFFVVYIGDSEISLATGSDPENALVFEIARMEKVSGPPHEE